MAVVLSGDVLVVKMPVVTVLVVKVLSGPATCDEGEGEEESGVEEGWLGAVCERAPGLVFWGE